MTKVKSIQPEVVETTELAIVNDQDYSWLSVPQEQVIITSNLNIWYLNFFSTKSEKALEIRQAIPTIQEGDPFLNNQMDIKDARYGSFFIIQAFFYNACMDELTFEEKTYHPYRSENGDPCCRFWGFFVDDHEVYQIGGRAKTTKLLWLEQLLSAQNATTSQSWATSVYRAQLMKLPPQFRVCAKINTQEKKSKSGRPYIQANAGIEVPAKEKIEMLLRYIKDHRHDYDQAKELFETKKNMIIGLTMK